MRIECGCEDRMWVWCYQVQGAIGMIGRRPNQQNLFSADNQYRDFVSTDSFTAGTLVGCRCRPTCWR